MAFECKKVEACFTNSRTYEYRLPFSVEVLQGLLTNWQVRVNLQFRRPLLVADKDGVNLKGILAGPVIKVSFPESGWEEAKDGFEKWLQEITKE